MTTSLDVFCQDLIERLNNDRPFFKQVLEIAPKLQKSRAESLVTKLRTSGIPSRCRVILLDVKEYEDFEGLFNSFVNATFEALDSPSELAELTKEDILNESDASIRMNMFDDVLYSVASDDIRLILVLANYEEAASRWKSGDDFGYVRSLLGGDIHMSAVVFTAKPMVKVSNEPEGSSPLWNIFDSPIEIVGSERSDEYDVTVGDVTTEKPTSGIEESVDSVGRGREDEVPSIIAGEGEDSFIGERGTEGDVVRDKEAGEKDGNLIRQEKEGVGFIGREKELVKLNELASAETPKHLSIFGLPHVGKTTLVREWIKEIQDKGGRTPSGRVLYILNGGELSGHTVDYTAVVSRLMSRIKTDFLGKRNAGGASGAQALSALFENNGVTPLVDAEEATQRLREAIQKINEVCGLRVTLILDEFEYVDNWKEEEYRRFCMLLLDRKLDLFCIAVSRPHVSYITSEHRCKIIPFESHLLSSFSEIEMEEYFRRLRDNGGLNLVAGYSKDKRRLLYACGKNPYLLNELAKKICADGNHSIQNSLEELNATVKGLYNDVVTFMLDEEKKKQRSFTHVVKCFLGMSDDYDDIIDRYIDLGYIEKIESTDSFSMFFDRYARFDDQGNLDYYYMTVSPGFIDYLHTGCVVDSKTGTQSDILEHIKDIRDLFTGLVHSLRRITEEELKKNLKEELRKNLTEELKRKNVPANQAESTADGLVPHDDKKYPWHEFLMNCFFAKKGDNKQEHYALHKSKASNDWDDILRVDKTNNEISGRIKDRIRWNRFEDVRIRVSQQSLRYAIKALQKGGGGSEILDSISLVDHAKVLCRYPGFFANYFGILGDLNNSQGKENLSDCLNDINENVRNPLSHYSRRKLPNGEMKLYRELCIELLKSIYVYIVDGKRVAQNVNIRHILDIIDPERARIRQQRQQQANATRLDSMKN